MEEKKEKTPFMPPPLDDGVRIGNYRIVGKPIGEGGMGRVYRCEHVHMGTPAAVKVLLPQFAQADQVTQRLVNEAKAASSLNHRNIVTVHDVGQRESGEWYMVLQYLDGNPLSKFIKSQGGPIALPTILQIVVQIANGLHRAHKAGIVHRDLKPENVFLTQTEINDHHVTILDFGIARMPSDIDERQTKTGTVLGTPAYMAPEQLRAEDVDPRADVYALGVITWEMSTGERLWKGAKGNAVLIAAMQEAGARPLNPCAVCSHLPPAWGAAVARALSPNRAARWATMQDFGNALAQACPATGWSENGFTILARYALELAKVGVNAETAGSPSPHADDVTVPAVVDAGVPVGYPEVAMTPSPGVNPNAVSRTGPTAVERPHAAPIVGPIAVPLAAPVASPSEPTTLGGSAAQSFAVEAAGARRRRTIAIVAGATVGLVLAAVLAGNLASSSEQGAAGEPTDATTAAVPVVDAGAVDVPIDASLPGDAAGDPHPPVDAAPRSSPGRRRTPRATDAGSTTWDPNDVIDP